MIRSPGNYHEVEPTAEERVRARELHEKGYFQESRKYRRVVQHYGPNYDPHDRGVAPPFDHDARNHPIELTPGEFKAFFELREEYDALWWIKYTREEGARFILAKAAREKNYNTPHAVEAFVAGGMLVLKGGYDGEA